MSLILLIETATPICSVALAKDGLVFAQRTTAEPNAHSSQLLQFIEELLTETQTELSSLDAVAVSMGPGSYTGLRIGVSTAKGICYGTGKPLIAVSTLQAMAHGLSAIMQENILYAPMIDARRMEVYNGIYNLANELIKEVSADIITEESFSNLLQSKKIVFFGDGAAKCRNTITHSNALFNTDYTISAGDMAVLAQQKMIKKEFEDTAYFEPFYLKDFVAGKPSVKGLV